ncbi:hypothetical protein D3C81_1278470 [compost metagenome]
MPGQAVGAFVQLRVAQCLVAGDNGHSLWRTLHLRFKQAVQRLLQVVIDVGGIEAEQQRLPLLVRQHRQAVQRLLRCVLQRFNQRDQRVVHVLAEACCTDARRGHHRQCETTAEIIDVEGQRVIGALLAGQGFDALPGLALGSLLSFAVAMAVIEHRAKQW